MCSVRTFRFRFSDFCSAQSVFPILYFVLSASIFCLFLRFSLTKIFSDRRAGPRGRGRREHQHIDCRSVYDKISNRLERRQRKTGRYQKFRRFSVCLTVFVRNYYWQRKKAGPRRSVRAICVVYMCRSF